MKKFFCVSEQGRDGILWTVFDGEPFMGKRIASFSDAEYAREYLRLLNIDGHTIIRKYTELIEKHPMYNRFIAHTPFDNDAAAIAWQAVREVKEETPFL